MRKEEKAHFGQTLRHETGPDRSTYQVNEMESFMGRKMGGGPRDVSHSLTSAGETVDYNDVPAKSRR